jgi:multimeric flavodoxin WrbA
MAHMNILCVVGSPRKGGNTDVFLEKVAEGARSKGATTETVRLSELVIGPCDACDACQLNSGTCAKKDDMQSLYAKILWADAL